MRLSLKMIWFSKELFYNFRSIMDMINQEFSLRGKVALVTGAARGIGKACALALAQAGADIVLGLRDRSTGQDVALQIQEIGRKALPVQMDVTQFSEIMSAVDGAMQGFGRIDILVNNAGVGKTNPVEQVTEDDFDHIISVNLKGTYFTAQAVGKIMIKQRQGRIINIGSQAGAVALPTSSVYCITKAGIAHMTRCMALEWAPYNILVNCVAPTFIETPGTELELNDPENKKSVIRRIPLGRIGAAMEVAWPVVFLSSPAASLITGATLLVDGGWTIQ
jgi:NAD(P)-dependent dehydrogenase (short-subunit alcohol dehydrogenase family)